MQKIFKSGDKVNGYTVIDYNDETKEYEFVCDECGTKKTGYYYHLMIVCAHYMRSNTRLSHILQGMKARCYNPRNSSYSNYGGRGITICDEWLKCPKAFEDWCLENNWRPGLQIDRINNDLEYSAENCRIVTPNENSNNKRNNVKITVGITTLTIAEWSKKLGYAQASSIHNYYHKHGYEQTVKFISQILNNKRKIRRSQKYSDIKLCANGTLRSIVEWAEIFHVQPKTIHSWMRVHGVSATIERIENKWKRSDANYITIDNLCLPQSSWGKKIKRSVSYIRELIRDQGREEAIRRITEQWHDILADPSKEPLHLGAEPLTIQGVTDSQKGWSKRLGYGIKYVNSLISRVGKEEAIRRITEQWEAIKKNEQ